MVCIIILNYNNSYDTINCIKSIIKYNTYPVKILVVDNGSPNKEDTNKILEYMASLGNFQNIKENSLDFELKPYNLLISEINDGYAKGNNKGLEFAYKDSDINNILIINNDVLFIEDIIPQLIDHQKSLEKCAIVCPSLYTKNLKDMDYNCARISPSNWENILRILFFYKDIFNILSKKRNKRLIIKNDPSLINEKSIEIDLPSGSCMLVNKKIFKKINSFDPKTFLYFEEDILYKKIKKIGLKNYCIPNLKCIHLGASSTKKIPSAFTLKTGIKSLDYYLKKYGEMSFTQKILWEIAKINMFLKIFIIEKKQNR